MRVGATLYERLGVAPDADGATLRAAYRRLARQLHPDVAGPLAADGLDMALVNEAWRVLSDPHRRRAYDATLLWPPGARSTGPSRTAPASAPGGRSPSGAARYRAGGAASGPGATSGAGAHPGAGAGGPGFGSGADASGVRSGRNGAGATAPQGGAAWAGTIGARREAWLAGLRLQIRRLGTQAARSATQTLVIRHRGMARQPYEELVPSIVDHLLDDTAERIRLARLAGAAPLDLAIGAALVGLRVYADELIAAGRRGQPAAAERVRAAEMIDRMWDTMAHEIPRELALALGGNPRTARHLRP